VSRRVLLHVGTPKTGTSHLQDVLFRNRDLLRRQGVLYAAERFDAHFLAALDLMQLPWGGLENEAVGAWDALAGEVREFLVEPGEHTAIISHEILATASRAQVARALASLGYPDIEVHVVLSVRDLVRQIPAEWQENVKHRRELPYGKFLDQVRDPDRKSAIGAWFWGVQEIPDILDRWAADLPPERVHVVTVPRPGGPRDLLWERFSATFGLDDLELDVEPERANPSLGVPETTAVRRINIKANKLVPPAAYRPLVRELVAHRTLSQRTDSPRLTLPPEDYGWVADLQQRWTDVIRERGYDVVGDLDDLIGDPPPATYADPDTPDEAQVADAALDAVTALLVENARLVRVEQDLRAELDGTRRELERAYLRPTYRWREKTVRRLQASRPGRFALRLYRAARGRSSRSA
jgi:hypothetical protein